MPDMEIVRINADKQFSPLEECALFSFALKSAHQKLAKNIPNLESKSVLFFALSMRKVADSRCLKLVTNYSTAVKISAIHHIYHTNSIGIANLDILHPISISKTLFGVIGSYCGIDIIHSQHKSMERFPPILINSKVEYPITVNLNRKAESPSAVKNVIVDEDAVFANCGKIFEAEYRTALSAHENMEHYKRTIKDLSRAIKETF